MILYSSHVLEVVEKVCTQVMILRKGQVVANDSVENLAQPDEAKLARRYFFGTGAGAGHRDNGERHCRCDESVSRYLWRDSTACVIQRSARLGAALFGAFKAQAQFAVLIRAENAQTRDQTTEIFHRFPIFASQILIHTMGVWQFSAQ